MKKIMLVSLVTVLIAAWGVRFYFVNQNIDTPIVQVFPKGTEVPMEKDFFYDATEDMDGYTVEVLGAELLTLEDFLERYHTGDQSEALGNFTDYIYSVRVSISNKDNDFTGEKGIALGLYYLKGTDYVLSLEDMCYQFANPNMPGTSFSLQKGTSMELVLPFNVMSTQTSPKHILDDPPKLQISLYPHQKLLELY